MRCTRDHSHEPVRPCSSQVTKSPTRQRLHFAQNPPWQPTPTRSPTAHSFSLGPTATTSPTISCPGIRGRGTGNVPFTIALSLRNEHYSDHGPSKFNRGEDVRGADTACKNFEYYFAFVRISPGYGDLLQIAPRLCECIRCVGRGVSCGGSGHDVNVGCLRWGMFCAYMPR